MNFINTISQIISRTPIWVWGLLALLIALGLSYTRTRRLGMARLLIVPLLMMALSVNSLYSAFGTNAAVFAAWMTSLLIATLFMQSIEPHAQYHSDTRSFTVMGSWVPLILILAIFCARYAYAVTTLIQPQWKTDTAFVLGFAAAYGLLSGYFTGRVLSIIRTAPR